MNLDAIFSPLTTSKLVEVIQDSQPTFVPGLQEKFNDLFDLEELKKTLNRSSADGPSPDVCAGLPPEPIRPELEEVFGAVDRGLTVCLSSLDRWNTKLRRLCLSAESALGFPGRALVNCYLSPPGTGFNALHIDDGVAITLQIQGTKEWQYSPKPEFPWATIKGGFSSTSNFRWFHPTPNFPTVPMPDQSRLIKRTLTPGDILLIPPGTLHAAQACDERSLSLNLKLQWGSTLEHLLRAVQPRLLPQASWRAPLPFLPLSDKGPDSDHSETRNQISLRLKELAKEILDLAEDPIALQSLWFESLMGSQPEISKQPGHRLIPGSATLRLPRDTHPRLCALMADGKEQLLLFFRTTSFVFSGDHVRRVLERVLALRSFVASELLEDSSDWVQTQVLLTVLVRKGILEDVSQ